jgi:hypothetical protein
MDRCAGRDPPLGPTRPACLCCTLASSLRPLLVGGCSFLQFPANLASLRFLESCPNIRTSFEIGSHETESCFKSSCLFKFDRLNPPGNFLLHPVVVFKLLVKLTATPNCVTILQGLLNNAPPHAPWPPAGRQGAPELAGGGPRQQHRRLVSTPPAPPPRPAAPSLPPASSGGPMRSLLNHPFCGPPAGTRRRVPFLLVQKSLPTWQQHPCMRKRLESRTLWCRIIVAGHRPAKTCAVRGRFPGDAALMALLPPLLARHHVVSPSLLRADLFPFSFFSLLFFRTYFFFSEETFCSLPRRKTCPAGACRLLVWLLRLSFRSKKKKERAPSMLSFLKALDNPSSSDSEPERRNTKSKKKESKEEERAPSRKLKVLIAYCPLISRPARKEG